MAKANDYRVLHKISDKRVIAEVDVANIQIDTDYQRWIMPKWSKEIADHLDPNKLGIGCVAQRSDGSGLYAIDCQH